MSNLAKSKCKWSIRVPVVLISAALAAMIQGNALAESPLASLYDSTPGDKVVSPGADENFELKGETPDQRIAGRIRDIGLSLSLIKHEAIEIFLEVTRRPVTLEDNLAFHLPASISDKLLNSDVQYQPPRKAWLLYYVSSLEPIIDLYQHHIKAACDGTSRHPLSTPIHEALEPTFEKWRVGVASINDHLNNIFALADQDGANNLAIAKEAVGIYQDVESAENAWQKAVIILRQRLKHAD